MTTSTSFTIASTEGTHRFCADHEGTTLDHNGWLAFVSAARLDGSCGAKVRLVMAHARSSLTLDIEITERFTTLQNELAARARVAVELAEKTGRAYQTEIAKGYAWALGVMADA